MRKRTEKFFIMIYELPIEKLLKQSKSKSEKAHKHCKTYREAGLMNLAQKEYGKALAFSEISRKLKKILKESVAP